MRSRTTLSVGVIVALIVAVWAALSAGSDDEPVATTTTVTTVAPTTSTTSTIAATTTTLAPTTAVTETTVDSEARIEEVRLILEDLYFRWFDAIYRNDEQAVRGVIATQGRLEDFARAVEDHDYPRAPERRDVMVSHLEILRDEPNCLVTFIELDLSSWRGAEATGEIVDVMWPHENGWRFATSWQNETDLWQQDCTAERDDELP